MGKITRAALREVAPDEPTYFECPEYDDAIIGATEDSRVVYDFEVMVHCLMERENINNEDAIAFVEGSIQSCVSMENAPIIVRRIPKWARVCENCAKCSIGGRSFIVSCDKDNHVIHNPAMEGCVQFVEVDVDE